MEIHSAHYQAMGGFPNSSHEQQQQQEQEKKPRPQQEQLKCPRCDSGNTKFCYYNNYSLSQPRYFCKGCRRYWTQGGSLRNVPVGGGCRKNKRSSSSSTSSPSSSSSSSSSKRVQLQDQAINQLLPTIPNYDNTSDLTLAFAKQLHDPFLLPNPNPNPCTHVSTDSSGLFDVLRNGFLASNTNPSGFYNPCYGFAGSQVSDGAQEVVLPMDNHHLQQGLEGVDGGATATSTPTATSSSQESFKLVDGEESKGMMMGLQWQLGGGGNNVGMDPGRDLWTGVNSSSSWQYGGLINNSLF